MQKRVIFLEKETDTNDPMSRIAIDTIKGKIMDYRQRFPTIQELLELELAGSYVKILEFMIHKVQHVIKGFSKKNNGVKEPNNAHKSETNTACITSEIEDKLEALDEEELKENLLDNKKLWYVWMNNPLKLS